MKRNSQQGVALVITLILLSVITFMAVTFLAVSRRERVAVTTQSDQTDAKLAADAALERAKSAMIVPIMAFSNAQLVQLRVSTNFINPLGFESPLPPNGNRFTNVNYDFSTAKRNLKPLTPAQMEQNIANLLYDPRPPVFIRTNRAKPGVSDFRFYLDLNRNGRFDPSGFLPVTNNLGQQVLDANGRAITNLFIGDPEWVGVLERPDFSHSATNKFIARWAYIVLPAGAALDVNYIHNQTLANKKLKGGDGFERNQGFGSWEINLAAFLRDLNTNFWTYTYNKPVDPNLDNPGTAFDDARSFLNYRYAGGLNTLKSVANLFGPAAATAFARDSIDGYADGPLMKTVYALRYPPNDDNSGNPWPGADSVQHYFTTQEFFVPNKTSRDFTNRLLNASQGRSSYDQYTYYRLLSQLTTDSAPDPADKMNLNYDNLVQRNPISGTLSATNFIPWRPIDFFTNAANRLLQSVSNLGIFNLTVTNIPIYPTNYYTPAVHRLLQLAANMYDATTNRTYPGATTYPYLPSVFRPIFRKDVAGTNFNIFIAGYVEEVNARLVTAPPPYVDLRNNATNAPIRPLVGNPIDPNDPTEPMVYGIPLVIGAKKGFPNFNEFAMQNVVQVTRKLELRKDKGTERLSETNQMYVVGISNVIGVEAWNSYTNPYPRALDMYVTNQLSIVMTNEFAAVPPLRFTNLTMGQMLRPPNNFPIPANNWQGFVNPVYPQQSFRIPLLTNVVFLTNSVYRQGPPSQFLPLTAPFERRVGFPVPQWGLSVTNRLLYILVDHDTRRIVDYVDLIGLDDHIDITRELVGSSNVRNESSTFGNQWRTNRLNNRTDKFVPTVGIINQIEVSEGNQPVSLNDWNSFSLQNVNGQDKDKAIDGFRVFMGLSPLHYPGTVNTNLIQQAPFTPTRKIYHYTSRQANDPLVHYTLSDLIGTNDNNFITPPNQPVATLNEHNLAKINDQYQPWGGNPLQSLSQTGTETNAFNLAVKDPLVKTSNDWDFPTNKLPNLGWLGRVHRGTPWQTVYLKSALVGQAAWQKWTGNYFDPLRTVPAQDWNLLDYFTVAPNDNASRGQMSINNSDIAGWSAILSGVIVLTNSSKPDDLNQPQPILKFDPLVIEPAGVDGTNSPLWKIVDGINRERNRKDNNGNFVHPGQTFQHVGDFLATPELTVASPFLNVTNSTQLRRGLNDAVYERIPQQVLSLLKAGEPRFVIYSYGQSLKPADRSIVQSGPFSGMSTNYQITGETATRTVIRIEGAPNNPRAVIESFNVLPPD
ncbi:MAG: hypothetical protein HY298_04535 [Verrucomicrobia bacterium]|nr:hypothetical protein [Verrucomicrobiota bacterium]